jgi:hypothetical protein
VNVRTSMSKTQIMIFHAKKIALHHLCIELTNIIVLVMLVLSKLMTQLLFTDVNVTVALINT